MAIPVSTASATGTTSVTVSKPGTNWVSGSTLIAVVAVRGTTTLPSTPSGWTLLSQHASGGTSGAVSCSVFYQILSGAGSASYAFTGVGTQMSAGILEYSAATTAGPDLAGAATSNANGSTDTTLTFPSITTSNASEVVILAVALGQGSTTITGWSGSFATELYQLGTSGDGSVAVGDATIAAAGATGTMTVTQSASATHWSIVACALLPASATPFTGAVPSGSLASAGSAGSFEADFTAAPPSASLAISGAAGSASGGSDFTGAAPPGALGSIARAGAFVAALTFAAPIAPLAVGGSPAAAGAGLSVAAPPAGLSVAGRAAAFSAAFSGAPAAASAGVSGTAGSVSVGISLAAPAAAFGLDGYAGTFSGGIGFSGAGASAVLATSGRLGSIATSSTLAAPGAAIASTGYAAVYVTAAGFTAAAPTSALGVSSSPSTLSVAGTFAVSSAGALVVSGRPGSVLAGSTAIAPSGGLAARSIPGSVSAGAALGAAPSGLPISGYAASWTATADILAIVPGAFLPSIGFPASFAVGAAVFAPAGALASLGYAGAFIIPQPLVFASIELAPDTWWVELPLEVAEMPVAIMQLGPKKPIDSGWVRIGMMDWIASLQTPDAITPSPVAPIIVTVLDPAYVVDNQQIIGTDCYLHVSGGTPNGLAVLILQIRLSDGSDFERFVAQPIDG